MTDAAQPSPIIYTHTDEAPLLATYSFLPIVQAYAGQAGVAVETRDISLAGRIIAQFPERLTDEQRHRRRARRARRARQAARGQHHQAAQHLRLDPAAQGGDRRAAGARATTCPTTPTTPQTDEEKDVRARYDKVKGSAVNPVLREGNSDRRAPASVKHYARKHPHSMGAWSPDSKTNVAHHGRRRLPVQREVRRDRRPTTRCASSTWPPTARPPCSRSRSRCSPARSSTPPCMQRRRACDAFLTDADRPGQGRGRAVLGAPQGHDDEGLRPDHLRPRRAAPSSPTSSRSTATRSRPPASAPTTASARSSPASTALPDGAAIKAAVRGRRSPPARALAMVDSDRGITNLHVPVRRHRRRLDAGDDPHLAATCGAPTARRPTRSR